MNNIESKVELIVKNIINNLGYEIYDIQYTKEGQNNYLRIFIDKDGIIDINDCEKVNNAINDILDIEDPIKESYFLEVSSPGLERTLRKKEHYESQINNEIIVKLFKAIDNSKEIVGILTDVRDNGICIKADNKDYEIDFKNISIAKTIFNFDSVD